MPSVRATSWDLDLDAVASGQSPAASKRLVALARRGDPALRLAFAEDPRCPSVVLEALLVGYPSRMLVELVVRHANLDAAGQLRAVRCARRRNATTALIVAASRADLGADAAWELSECVPDVVVALALNVACPAELFSELALFRGKLVRWELPRNPVTPTEALAALWRFEQTVPSKDRMPASTLASLAAHPNVPADVVAELPALLVADVAPERLVDPECAGTAELVSVFGPHFEGSVAELRAAALDVLELHP